MAMLGRPNLSRRHGPGRLRCEIGIGRRAVHVFSRSDSRCNRRCTGTRRVVPMPVLGRPDFPFGHGARWLWNWPRVRCSCGRLPRRARGIMPVPMLRRPHLARGRQTRRRARRAIHGTRLRHRQRATRQCCWRGVFRAVIGAFIEDRHADRDADHENHTGGRHPTRTRGRFRGDFTLTAHFELAPTATRARLVSTNALAGVHRSIMTRSQSIRNAPELVIPAQPSVEVKIKGTLLWLPRKTV